MTCKLSIECISKCVLLFLFYCRFYRRAVGASNVANTLMIEGVRSYHAGQYQCHATTDGNNCITFFSLNATLTIIGEFKILSHSAIRYRHFIVRHIIMYNITVTLSFSSGEPVISSATEFSGSTTEDLSVTLSITGTTPTVQVYREGVLLADDPRVEFSFASTQFEMIISDLQRSDAGQYRIVATNDFDMAETTITVVPIGKSFFSYNYVMCILLDFGVDF